MKSFNQYILEALQNPITLLNAVKFDFSEVASMSNKTEDDREKKGKAQEKIFIDTLSEATNECTVMSIEEYCTNNKITYSPKVDSQLGDIVITMQNGEEYFIDLKVNQDTDNNNYVGTPTVLSLVNFANQKNHIYFLSNIKCTQKYIVDATKLYDLMLSKEKTAFFMTSYYREKNAKSFAGVEALNGKVNLKAPKDAKDNELLSTDHLDNVDFVATSTIRQNYNKIKA